MNKLWEAWQPINHPTSFSTRINHNYSITNGIFIHVLEHDDTIAVQDNHISQDYVVNAMSNYLANFSPPPPPPADATLPSAAAYTTFCQLSLSDFWQPL